MCYVVALTGGICSGKSTVAKMFSILGVEQIDSDFIANKIIESNAMVFKKIVNHFGSSIVNNYGTLNKDLLRSYIFNNYKHKKWLDDLLHPIINKETKIQLAKMRSSWVLWVVPLLVENKLQHQVNRILVVDVPYKTQVLRLINRYGITYNEAKKIVAIQSTRENRLSVADDVIENSGSLILTFKNVINLYNLYSYKSTNTNWK